MENLKIKVSNENESREAQELFFELGYSWRNSDSKTPLVSSLDYPFFVVGGEGGLFLTDSVVMYSEYKKITLPEIRDMVVLKRNNVGDANYKDAYRDLFYVASDLNIYIWQHDSWIYHCIQGDKKKLESMWKFRNTGGDVGLLINKLNDKETLNNKVASVEEYRESIVSEKLMQGIKQFNQTEHGKDFDDFELIDDEPRLEFAKGIELDLIAKRLDLRERYEGETDEGYRYALQHYVVFSARSSIDDEPKEKHSHYKKDISHLNILDVYRVLELFDVYNPCLQHAIKKLLCAGQRGAKDTEKDIQEAIDTLIRYKQMREEDNA